MRKMMLIFAAAALTGCNSIVKTSAPADGFITSLQQLCGKTFSGRLVTSDPADRDIAGQHLSVGMVGCTHDGVIIPFSVGDNHSRNWHISRNKSGVQLKHVHRHDNGSEDKLSGYGGTTIGAGTSTRQEFPADQYSKDLFLTNKLSQSVENIWAVEIVSGKKFAYELRRTNRFFRVEFDLTSTIP